MDNRKVNGWAISYGLRRAYAAQNDLLLFPDVRTKENVNCNPEPQRLSFNPANKPTLTNVGKFYWERGLCAFEDGVEKIFIYNQLGHAMDTAATEDEADDIIDALNNPTPRDAGIQRFAVGRKYAIKANDND